MRPLVGSHLASCLPVTGSEVLRASLGAGVARCALDRGGLPPPTFCRSPGAPGLSNSDMNALALDRSVDCNGGRSKTWCNRWKLHGSGKR